MVMGALRVFFPGVGNEGSELGRKSPSRVQGQLKLSLSRVHGQLKLSPAGFRVS